MELNIFLVFILDVLFVSLPVKLLGSVTLSEVRRQMRFG